MENIFQQHLNTHETLKARQEFELKYKDAGVIPLEYISNNGSAFTSKSYTGPFTCYIKPHLYSGTFLETAFGHIFGTYLFLCLIDAHGRTAWLGYHQDSLAFGHADGSSRPIVICHRISFLESNLVTITSPNVTSPTYLVNIVLHQDGRNGDHPHGKPLVQ